MNAVEPLSKNIFKLLSITILWSTVFLFSLLPQNLYALPADFYATNSKLSTGKWVKIEVTEEGMQFISNSTLKKLGFSDPSKVNVFGYGGRILSEQLDGNYSDDLPAVSSIQNDSGIMFFGKTTTGWNQDSGKMKFIRTTNHYNSHSYYYLSDCLPGRITPETESTGIEKTDNVITSFTERILHEKNLTAPAPSGRTYLGEDFRTRTNQTFQFKLTDIIGDAQAKICFAAKVSNGSSSILVSSNGDLLPSTSSDIIPGIGSSDDYLTSITTIKKIPAPGENLSLAISYSYSGVIFIGALDYIQLEYERKLKMSSNELQFTLMPVVPSEVRIDGVGDATEIWKFTSDAQASRVDFHLEGSTAVFTADSGFAEYIAFNPMKTGKSPSIVGDVKNQDIHSLEGPDLLIVAPQKFHAAAKKIADVHVSADNMSTLILTPEEIYNEFSSGSADPTAIRRLLKMWHDREGGNNPKTRHCLLIGRPTYDHLGLNSANRNRSEYPIPIWQSEDSRSSSTSYSTDDYIAMLDDNPVPLEMGNAILHVAVGRMPVSTLTEANDAAEKIKKYILDPEFGEWRNTVLTIADDQDHGDHLFQAENVVDAMREEALGNAFRHEKLYLDSYPLVNSGTGPSYPIATARLLDKFKEGVSLINYIGHASTREWTHESLLSWKDICGLQNSRLPFIFASTCDFLKWDADEISGGEQMWLLPNSGVIGMICPSRKVYISLNGNMSRNTMSEMFKTDSFGETSSFAEIAMRGKNLTKGETNRLRFSFLGDPALRMPRMNYRVCVDSINGISIVDTSGFPELKGGSRISMSGHISQFNGEQANDASGSLDFTLFDAEKTVETKGNGTDGEVCFYNDRNSKLFIGKTTVENGTWETDIIIPNEISDNFSPALLSFYYLDGTGAEGNGSCENLYVYGHTDNSEIDSDGPVFSDFYLDNPGFRNGDAVSPSPLLYASFSDPSGINISESGIGHEMTLLLDGTTPLSNVVSNYIADPLSPESGRIVYPLSGIPAGKHSLALTVWDNRGNSSTQELEFKVEAGWNPSIIDLSTDLSTASSYVTFILTTDGTDLLSDSRIEVFDLAGRIVWTGHFDTISPRSSLIWNLHDAGGARVPRGIYLYRAVAKSSSGAESSRSGKMAIISH